MSGHSKWAQIKRQKGVNDQKRGATFTKLANAITIAVKQGGGIGDPDQNFRLRLAVDAARNSNMPKENIERAIQRAAGNKAGDLEEVVYEGFASGGVCVMVEAATDNSMRTTAEVKSIFNKAGASFGQPGSVSYQFKHLGRIIVKKGVKTFDEIFADAVEDGAEEIEEVGDEVFIYTPATELVGIKDGLSQQGLEVVEADLIRVPIATIPIAKKEEAQRINNFLESLENLDEVQKVYSNMQEIYE